MTTFLNVVNAFSLFRYYLPMEKAVRPFIWRFPFTRDVSFVFSLIKIRWNVLKKRWKCENFTGYQNSFFKFGGVRDQKAGLEVCPPEQWMWNEEQLQLGGYISVTIIYCVLYNSN